MDTSALLENIPLVKFIKTTVRLLVSWFTVIKLECLEFITYEVVARSVASQPKKNAPLAKKLLRSTCISVAIYNISVQDKK